MRRIRVDITTTTKTKGDITATAPTALFVITPLQCYHCIISVTSSVTASYLNECLHVHTRPRAFYWIPQYGNAHGCFRASLCEGCCAENTDSFAKPFAR